MFYTIYQVTHIPTGKKYIGKHQTEDLDDGYNGSGKHLKQAIDKHGIDQFKKEILFVFDNEQEMNDKESELVTEDFCSRQDTYNICAGGKGGWSYVNQNINNQLTKEELSERGKKGREAANMAGADTKALEIVQRLHENPEWKSWFRQKVSDGIKENGSHWTGKIHTEETKQKLRKSKNVGVTNSQFGTIWITDGNENRKMKKDREIPEGWCRGRK